MSPIVFAYILLFALLLAAGAAALEQATRGRGMARHFWTAAIVLAVVAPCGALGWRAVTDRSTTAATSAASGPEALAAIVVNSGRNTVLRGSRLIGRDALIRMLLPSRHALSSALAQLNSSFAAVAIVAWVTLSLALMAWLAFGVFHWRRARRGWRRATLDGVSVDVSPVTGPAVVGLLSHRIVLPAWATTMQPEHRRLVLAHESEHISARDPERLALAIAALVLMPWNVGLWWCAARLRRAIELDCDTRVLRRFPGTKEYGYVLLEVASRGRDAGALAIPMVALLRLPSELELRLRAMTRARAVGTRGVIAGGIAAVVAIAAAFTTPVPSIAIHDRAPVARRYLPMPAGLIPSPRVSGDTGSKRRIDSVAFLKAENDSLRYVDRTLTARIAQLRSMPGDAATLDSAWAARAALRQRATTQQEHAQPSAQNPGTSIPQMTYFEFQVGRPARALPVSIAPAYPDALRRAGVGGEVRTKFVVDTTGRVDPRTVKITSATNAAFAAAVRAALPKMRFAPAKIGGRRVKQLVQQPFAFSVASDSK